jgi:hypothetical protein
MCGSAANQRKNTHIWSESASQAVENAGYLRFSGGMLWIVTSITLGDRCVLD